MLKRVLPKIHPVESREAGPVEPVECCLVRRSIYIVSHNCIEPIQVLLPGIKPCIIIVALTILSTFGFWRHLLIAIICILTNANAISVLEDVALVAG